MEARNGEVPASASNPGLGRINNNLKCRFSFFKSAVDFGVRSSDRPRKIPRSMSILYRSEAALGYDGFRNRLIMFGGRSESAVLGDTWSYDIVTGP